MKIRETETTKTTKKQNKKAKKAVLKISNKNKLTQIKNVSPKTKKLKENKPTVQDTQKTENTKTVLKPYSSVNETLAEIFSFHTKFSALKTVTEKEEYFKEVKERLTLTAQVQDHYLLKIFIKNTWNDSEYIGLLFAISLYVLGRKVLHLDHLFELANMNILQFDEIITVYSERKSKLFDEFYFDPIIYKGFALGSRIVSVINGRKIIPAKETPKEIKSKKTLSVALKSVKSICAELSKYVIGQEKAKKVLATALFEHILRISLKEQGSKHNFSKKNVLLLGPTGCGKTYLCQVLAKIANIPFMIADATQYTAAGYVGGDAQDLIVNIAQQTETLEGGTIPLSIVFIDEFDKLKFAKDGKGFDMTRKTQETLLKVLESEKYTCSIKSSFSRSNQTYDISKILFVASGAFSDLDENAKEENVSIGFAPNTVENKDEIDIVKITKYGFLPEILGRLTYRVRLEELNKEQLRDILTKAENNPIQQYEELFQECGKKLVIPETVIGNIIDKALLDKTGARGLNTILGEYLQEQLGEMELPEKVLNA